MDIESEGTADNVLHHILKKYRHMKINCNFCKMNQYYHWQENSITHTHTHIRLMALFPGLPRWAGTRKVKPIWISLKQETVGGSGISWAICKSAPSSRQITTPAPHHSSFLQAGCPSCRPTNSVKALKAKENSINDMKILHITFKGYLSDMQL